MSEVLEPTTTTQGWAGPQTHEEANCYHQGFLGGLTVYARERGESTLKSQNPLLARLMDEQGFATIETFERLPAITPAGFALTKDELKLCAELPDALVALADFHDSKASMAAAMGYRESLFGLLLMLTASAALGVRVAYLKGKCDGIAEEMERMAWKPIRTSPNDGTWFLCHQAGTDGIIRISSARWNEGELGGKGWSYCPHSMPQYWMPISEQFTE